jgi:uncharacterized membrane protein YccC
MALAHKLAVEDSARADIFAMRCCADMKFQADALGGQLRAVFELARNATPQGQEAFEKREAAQPLWLRFTGRLATLRANLSLSRSVFRHAVRLTLCVAAGDAIGAYAASHTARTGFR